MFLGSFLTAEALHPGNTLNETCAPQDGIALLQLLALQRGCRGYTGDRKLVPGILVVLLQSIAQTGLQVTGGNNAGARPL